MADNPIAQAIANQMNLMLPRTAQEIARHLFTADALAQELSRSGLIRKVGVYEGRLRAAGITTRVLSERTTGSVVYLTAGCTVHLEIEGPRVEHIGRDSEVEVGACDWLASDQRLHWRQYALLMELLRRLLEGGDRPELITVEMPLLLSVGDLPTGVDDEELDSEFERFSQAAGCFWDRYLPRLFPFDPSGPVLVSLQHRSPAAILQSLRRKGQAASPDLIPSEVFRLLENRWEDFRRVGASRLLGRLLAPGCRTPAFDYRALGVDQRCQPALLAQKGLMGLFLRTSPRNEPWQVELPGGPTDWSTGGLDWVAELLGATTLFNLPNTVPLPLFYSRELLQLPREYLAYFRKAVVTEARHLGAPLDDM